MLRTSERVRELSTRLYDWANGERPGRFEDTPRAPSERRRDRRAMMLAAAGTTLVAGGVIAAWSAMVLPIRKMTPLAEKPIVAVAPPPEDTLAAGQPRSSLLGTYETPAQTRPAPPPQRLPPPEKLPPPQRQAPPDVAPPTRPQTPLGGVDGGATGAAGSPDAGTSVGFAGYRPGPRPGSLAAPPIGGFRGAAAPGGVAAGAQGATGGATANAGANANPGASANTGATANAAAPGATANAAAPGATGSATAFGAAPGAAANTAAPGATAGAANTAGGSATPFGAAPGAANTAAPGATAAEAPVTAPGAAQAGVAPQGAGEPTPAVPGPVPAPAPNAPATADAIAGDANALRLRINATRVALANLPEDRRTSSTFNSVVQRVGEVESRLAASGNDPTQLTELFRMQLALEQDLASLQR